MTLVVPLVRIGDHHRVVAEGELRTPLIARRAHPPVFVREGPTGPLHHAVVGRAKTGHLRVVQHPAARGRPRPHFQTSETLFAVRTQGQRIEILGKQAVGDGLSLK